MTIRDHTFIFHVHMQHCSSFSRNNQYVLPGKSHGMSPFYANSPLKRSHHQISFTLRHHIQCKIGYYKTITYASSAARSTPSSLVSEHLHITPSVTPHLQRCFIVFRLFSHYKQYETFRKLCLWLAAQERVNRQSRPSEKQRNHEVHSSKSCYLQYFSKFSARIHAQSDENLKIMKSWTLQPRYCNISSDFLS